jgi:exosortase
MRRVAQAAPVPSHRAALGAVALLLALVYLPTLVWLVGRWSMGVWYHVHGFVVFPIAAWLAWRRLRIFEDAPRDASPWGFAFLLPAIALQVLDAMLGFELLSAVSLVLAIPGLALLFLGRARTKAIWFPLFFLAFAVPIPLMVARKIHFVLRQVTAVGTGQVLEWMGYPLLRQGTQIQIGPEVVEIADACSGFSTLTALFMVSMLLAYLASLSGRRGALLVGLVFPFAAAANVVRCVGLVMLVAAFGPGVLATAVHPLSGVVTFGLALGLLLQAEKLLKRGRPS